MTSRPTFPKSVYLSLACISLALANGRADELKFQGGGGNQNYIPMGSVMEETTLDGLLRETSYFGLSRNPPDDGDLVYLWDPSSQGFLSSNWDALDGGWNPNYTISPGDVMFFYYNRTSDTNTCFFSDTNLRTDVYQVGDMYVGNVTNFFSYTYNYFTGNNSLTSDHFDQGTGGGGFQVDDELLVLDWDTNPCETNIQEQWTCLASNLWVGNIPPGSTNFVTNSVVGLSKGYAYILKPGNTVNRKLILNFQQVQ